MHARTRAGTGEKRETIIHPAILNVGGGTKR